jgi:transposase
MIHPERGDCHHRLRRHIHCDVLLTFELAASALVASIADARSFENGRQVSAWLGHVPRQSSSGGKATLRG